MALSAILSPASLIFDILHQCSFPQAHEETDVMFVKWLWCHVWRHAGACSPEGSSCHLRWVLTAMDCAQICMMLMAIVRCCAHPCTLALHSHGLCTGALCDRHCRCEAAGCAGSVQWHGHRWEHAHCARQAGSSWSKCFGDTCGWAWRH